ncbi:MAG: hypothetical protein QMD14_05665, partial [Candidatus Aenigmarchaeota archaeon]|nr:hypothetical protein [Candidatus Aenigmarchaeota archaeon]
TIDPKKTLEYILGIFPPGISAIDLYLVADRRGSEIVRRIFELPCRIGDNELRVRGRVYGPAGKQGRDVGIDARTEQLYSYPKNLPNVYRNVKLDQLGQIAACVYKPLMY